MTEPIPVHVVNNLLEPSTSRPTPVENSLTEDVTDLESNTSKQSVTHIDPQKLSETAYAGTDQVQPLRKEGSQNPLSTPNVGSHIPVGDSKVKGIIKNLEQFIEYAYSRKGQRVRLQPKIQKLIVQNPKLNDFSLSRLLTLAENDHLLAVPRQLLLLSREIEGYPSLRTELVLFVSKVVRRHSIFSDPSVQGALQNLPDATSAEVALESVLKFTPREQEGREPLKGGELQVLRRNAANLFVTWIAINRGMNSDGLIALLFQVVWHPAALDLKDDSSQIRALTELEQVEGVGLSCLRFQQQAIEARTSEYHALREATVLRMRLAETEAQRVIAEEIRESLQLELKRVRECAASELAELRRKHEEERTHLRHGHEQLGGRLVRRLKDAVETLEVGLNALRNKTPRVEVMTERAELVVEDLRAEIKNLIKE